MINMNFWHKAELLHLRILNLGGMSKKKLKRVWDGSCNFFMVVTHRRGRITIRILYCIGVDIHVNIFSAGFPKMYRGQSVGFFLLETGPSIVHMWYASHVWSQLR